MTIFSATSIAEYSFEYLEQKLYSAVIATISKDTKHTKIFWLAFNFLF